MAKGRCTSKYTAANCKVGHYGTPLNFSAAWSPDYFTSDGNGGLQTVNMTAKPVATELVDHFERFIRSVPAEKPVFAMLFFSD